METNKFPFESYLPFWNVKLGVSIANEWILRALEKLSDSNKISGMLKASPFSLSLQYRNILSILYACQKWFDD